jgi:hypothetical protein
MSDPFSLLGDDPEIQALIRERAASLINDIFDQAESDLHHGDAGARSAAYKNLLPMLMKIAQSTTSSESETERLLEEGRKILEGMQASLPTYDAFEDDDPDASPFDDRD